MARHLVLLTPPRAGATNAGPAPPNFFAAATRYHRSLDSSTVFGSCRSPSLKRYFTALTIVTMELETLHSIGCWRTTSLP